MADVEIGRNEVEDPVLARRIEDEITEAASHAADPEGGLACSILDEGLHLEIEVEVPGFVETVKVTHPDEPGSVGRAVFQVLRDLGLTAA